MVLHPVTIDIPEGLFSLLEERASKSKRTVQQELLDVLGKKLTSDEGDEQRMERVLEEMRAYSDRQLWEAANARLPPGSNQRSQELNDKQRETGLTPSERIERESLTTQYEWHMLLRAKALALLVERGHDISPLLTLPADATA